MGLPRKNGKSALGAGIDLRADEVYTKLGYTVPGDDDQVITGGQAAPALDLPGF